MEVLLAVIGSSALASCISGIFTLIASRKNKSEGVESGVRILLYKQIKDMCNEYLRTETITAEQYEDLIKMHQIYHGPLGGNGYLDTSMACVKDLYQRVQGGHLHV